RGDRPPARRPGHPLAGEVRSASIAHRSAKTGSCARSQSSSKTNRDRIVRAEKLMSSDPSIAALFLATGTAHADPLPNIYLGRWCHSGNGLYGMVKTEKEWEACRDGDGYMEIKRYGWARHEEDCKFVSVKYTGEKTPASTKPTKKDWIPVVRITARCVGEDATWKSRITFKYVKGGMLSAVPGNRSIPNSD